MRREALRFGIADGAGHRAATWKLWTDGRGAKADLYLACRALGGHLKSSLHASGQWHTAYSQKTFDANVKEVVPEGKDRFIERWLRPNPLVPGVVLAFRIVTPASSVRGPITPSDAGVLWLPNAPEGKATEIDILIVAASTAVSGWPGKRSMGTSLIGSIQLGGGETAWAVRRVIDIPKDLSLPRGSGRFYKGRSRADLENANLRALVLGTELDGSRVIYDWAVDARSATKPLDLTTA